MKAGTDGEIALKIKQLRLQLGEAIHIQEIFNDDFYLHRWLISRGNNVDRTETAIRESIVWRLENNIEELSHKKFDPEVMRDVPIYMDHYTKAGQPVVKINCDGIDLRTLMKKYGKEFSLAFVNQMYAKFERLMMDHHNFHSSQKLIADATNLNDNKCSSSIPVQSPLVIIGSFKDFSLWNAKSLDVIHLFVEGSKTGIKYFPCMATHIYMLDNNRISAMLFKMVKPIVATMPYKIECYDCDKKKWAPELHDILDHYSPSHEFYNKPRLS